MTAPEAKSPLGVSPGRTKGWRETFLGELCDGNLGTIQTGPFGSQLHASDYRLTGIPVINPTHLRLNAIDESQVPRISTDDADRLSRHCLREGDILISRRGDFSRYSYIGTKQSGWLCGTGCLLIRLRHPDVDNRFLAASMSLETIQKYLKQAAVGSIMPNLNTNILSEMPLLFPPVQEQRAIVKLLDALQDVLKVRQRELALEQERKAALMEYLFTHGTRGEPTKQTEIGEIPVGWQVTKLGDACEFLQYGTSSKCNTISAGVPVLGIPNVVQGRVASKSLRFLQATEQERKKLKLRNGDIIFVRTNANREYTGRCAVFRDEFPEALFASYLIRARLNAEKLTPDFVREYTATSRGKLYLSGRASNAADGKFNINTQTIRAVLVPLPQIEEQREITTALRACDSKLDLLEEEIGILDELFKATLEELMIGRLSAIALIEEPQAQ